MPYKRTLKEKRDYDRLATARYGSERGRMVEREHRKVNTLQWYKIAAMPDTEADRLSTEDDGDE